MEQEIFRKIRTVVGEDNLSDSPIICEAYYSVSFGRTFRDTCRRPDMAVMPENAEQIFQILKLANEFKIPVVARGNATALAGGNIPLRGGILLDMSRMNKVLEINERRLVAVVEGGCTVNTLFYELDKRKLAFPVRPWFDPHMFLGAFVSTNGDGDFSNYHGNVGDNVIGLEVVLATGEIMTLGSGAYAHGFGHYNRIPAGPDLIGIFVGSIGIFGIITKVALRLIHKREHIWYRSIAWPRENSAQVSEALSNLFRYGVSGFHLHNRWAFKGLIDKGYLTCPENLYFILNLMQVAQNPREFDIAGMDILQICKDSRGVDLGREFCEKCQGPPYYFTTAGSMSGRSSLTGGRATLKPGMENMCFYSDLPVDAFSTYWNIFEDVADHYGFCTVDRNPILNMWGSPPSVLSSYSVISFLQRDRVERERALKVWNELAKRMIAIGVNPHPIGALWPKKVLENLGGTYGLMKKIKNLLDPNDILNPGQL